MVGNKAAKNHRKRSHCRILEEMKINARMRKRELNKRVRRHPDIQSGCEFKHINREIFETMA